MKIETGWDAKVVDGAIPSRSAVASTKGLKEEPAWRSPWTARLNWLCRKLSPPYIATISPVRGRIATSAADGPDGSLRTDSIDRRASFCNRRSIVVWTSSPPPKTFRVPYLEISCCLT
jgi:hypothetical protein